MPAKTAIMQTLDEITVRLETPWMAATVTSTTKTNSCMLLTKKLLGVPIGKKLTEKNLTATSQGGTANGEADPALEKTTTTMELTPKSSTKTADARRVVSQVAPQVIARVTRLQTRGTQQAAGVN